MTDDILSGLMRVNRQWIKFCKGRLAPYQYVGAMHLIVAYVHKYPGSCQEDVAEFYSLDKASVARDALRLEKLGHMQRQVSPECRRQYCLYLTEPGREMAGVLRKIYAEFRERMLASLSPEEKELLSRLLEQISRGCESGP